MARYIPIAESRNNSLDVSITSSSPYDEATERLLIDEKFCNKLTVDEEVESKHPIASIATLALITCSLVFACAVVTYGIRYSTAATDDACERKAWPFSMSNIVNELLSTPLLTYAIIRSYARSHGV